MPAATDRPPAAVRGRHWLQAAASLVVLPGLFLYSGLFQRFPLPGWVDPGIYLGYFFDLPQLAARYGFNSTTYHGTRLSWVLPGYWLHHLLGAAAAQECLVALMYFGSICSAFLAGRGIAGRFGGHLAAAFLAYNPLFITAVAFGAVDGAAVSYLMGAAAFLFGGGREAPGWMRLAGFGAMACLGGIAHPFALPLAAAMLGGHWILMATAWRQLPWQAGTATLGAVLAYVACACAGLQYGFRFWFPLDSVSMTQRALSGIGVKYRLPLAEWLYSSYRVLIPCLLLLALLSAWRMAEPRWRRMLAGVAFALGASSALFLLFDLLFGGLTLQVRNYTNLTLPAAALAVAALGAVVDRRFHARDHVLLIAPGIAVAAAYAARNDWLGSRATQLAVFAVLAIGGVAAALAAARKFRLSGAGGHPLVLAATVLACGALNQDLANVYVARTGVSLKEAYLGAAGLARDIAADSGLAKRELQFWYRRDAFTTGRPVADRFLEYRLRFGEERYRFSYYDTLSSLYLYDRSLLGADFPEVDPSSYGRLLARSGVNTSIVLVAQAPRELEVASRILADRGWEVRQRHAYKYDAPSFGFLAWILDLCRLDAPPGQGCNAALAGVKR